MGRPKIFDREKFLNTTTQLFWKKGFAAAGLSEILDATGVSKSSLYAEFKDKDDVFNECIKHYRAHLQSAELLKVKPLGWKNIEIYLKGACEAEGTKGCFVANSVREFKSIPEKSKREIAAHSKLFHQLLVDNVKATGTKKNADILATTILTFSSGVALKLNAVDPNQIFPEIDMFLDILKK
jgi:AcrR family transcriptional regulator